MDKLTCQICSQDKIVFYTDHGAYSLYRCQECDLIFVYPLPSDLASIYRSGYFKKESSEDFAFGYTDYDKDKEPMRPVFVSYLKHFESLATGRSLFDVGTATGFFLDLAKARGWNTAGVELSKFAGQEAARRGHRMLIGNLLDHTFSEKYDVVTLWDVLEHVDRPNDYIRKVGGLLKPGGYVAINTPDVSSWWARLLGKRWHLMIPPEHLFYYSPKNLRRVLEQNGFRVIKFKKIGKRFSLPYFFKTGYEWQKFFLWRLLWKYFDKGFWRNISIPFNLRDNIFVLAQKK